MSAPTRRENPLHRGRAGGPKTLEWVETTNHIELYDSEPHLDQALEELVVFYERELTPG